MRSSLVGAVLAGLAAASGVASPAALADPPERGGDVIRTWTAITMKEVRANRASDAQAARAYALVDAAMFDAVNGIAGRGARYQPAIVAPQEGTAGDPMVAAATAAHDLLVRLYPNDKASTYDPQLVKDLARASSPAQSAKGQQWGEYIAQQVWEARQNDGISGSEPQAGGTGLGEFTLLWNTQPRHLKPFVIDDPAGYVGGPPPAISSEEYERDYEDVRTAGSAGNHNPESQEIFDFWALPGGSNQPAGAWLQVAEVVSSDLSLIDTARLFALEAMALADTVAPTYEVKARYHHWRPETAIRYDNGDGANDGNPDTAWDPTWRARGGVASTPQHYSGHSAFSAAAAQVLAGFFCIDAIPFSLDTYDTKGLGARDYDSFSQAAEEAGRSRVYGGQHFEFSNQAALAAGRAIGAEVMAVALLPANGQPPRC